MNSKQRQAFGVPAYEAEQTLDGPHWGVTLGGQTYSILLSCNVGLE